MCGGILLSVFFKIYTRCFIPGWKRIGYKSPLVLGEVLSAYKVVAKCVLGSYFMRSISLRRGKRVLQLSVPKEADGSLEFALLAWVISSKGLG